MRERFKHIYLSLIGQISTYANSVHILNSHFISLQNSKADDFRTLLKRLNNDVDFITIEEGLNLIENGILIDKPKAVFTFDDGFEECYTQIAPVLEEYGAKGVFFVNPGFIEGDDSYIKDFIENQVLTPGKKPMNWDMVRDLHKRGHTIGSHTFDHVRLDIDDVDLIEKQVVKSKNKIEEKLGSKCDYFAFPYGQIMDLSETALEIIEQNHKYIFSGAEYKNYFSFNGRVLNRRHIEGDWDFIHVKYFLSFKRKLQCMKI
jgi:peptidoglycan/xylan/chitin deacetylase (PgdA/CDA1 family)